MQVSKLFSLFPGVNRRDRVAPTQQDMRTLVKCKQISELCSIVTE